MLKHCTTPTYSGVANGSCLLEVDGHVGSGRDERLASVDERELLGLTAEPHVEDELGDSQQDAGHVRREDEVVSRLERPHHPSDAAPSC